MTGFSSAMSSSSVQIASRRRSIDRFLPSKKYARASCASRGSLASWFAGIWRHGGATNRAIGGLCLGAAQPHQVAPEIAAAVDLDEAGQGHGGKPGRLCGGPFLFVPEPGAREGGDASSLCGIYDHVPRVSRRMYDEPLSSIGPGSSKTTWPHGSGSGLSIQLEALPIGDRIVLTEPKADDAGPKAE
jgi:hypothetical protein